MTTHTQHWISSDDCQNILSALLHTMPSPCFVRNSDDVILNCNAAFAEGILGTDCDTIVGRPLSDLVEIIPSTLMDICLQNVEPQPHEPVIRTREAAIACADGVQRDFVLRQSAFADQNGALAGTISVMLDFTDKNRAEKMLQDQNAELVKSNQELKRQIKKRKKAKRTVEGAHREFEHLITSLPTILIGLSRDHKIIHWNAKAARVFNLPAADVLGLTLEDCGVQWDWDKISDGILKSQADGRNVRVDNIHFCTADGEDRYLGLSIMPFKGEYQSLLGLTIIGADITDRIKFEVQMQQSQKMEAIGQLAAGIAHEINTPTQFVGDNTRFLQDAFSDFIEICNLSTQMIAAAKSKSLSEQFVQEIETQFETLEIAYLVEEVPQAIQQTLKGIDRITNIVQAMKIFAHPGGIEKEPIDINKEIEKTITITRNEWKYVAEMTTEFDASLPSVPCHRAEFNQVVLNLIVNAAHAIADVNREPSCEKGIITISSARDGDRVEIRISDTGPGIPEEIRHRIFDLFFTTKEPGRGTGQGLAIAHSVIVDKHGGTIEIETEENRGTTFVIRLPLDANTSAND